MIDLRSDTVTKPSEGMRKAIANAEVGDDVFGEDPTVRALEERVAELFGKKAALFVSSGTMGNQLAIATQTRHGDEVIVGEGAHPVHYEAGAGAALSGVQFAVAGFGGTYTESEMRAVVRGQEYWVPKTSLVCVENTHNRAGGRIFPQNDVIAIGRAAKELNLAFHLDGARIWNASIATKHAFAALAQPFDTVSVCFSKGLGAPAGSALLGSRAIIAAARRFRKMWGGAMRQSGILAAAATYALTNNVPRLAEDHAHARIFAERVKERAEIEVTMPETNIAMIDVPCDASSVSAAAKEAGLLINAVNATRLRAVTHLDVSKTDVERAADILADAISSVKKAASA
jgi:threonine aldolase